MAVQIEHRLTADRGDSEIRGMKQRGDSCGLLFAAYDVMLQEAGPAASSEEEVRIISPSLE